MNTLDRREPVALLVILGIVLAYMAAVLASEVVDARQLGSITWTFFVAAVAMGVVIGTFAFGVLVVRNWPRGGGPAPMPTTLIARWLRDRWRQDRLLGLIVPPLVFALLIAAFNAFKQFILMRLGFGYDPILAEIDRTIFFGVDPWRITHALLPSPWETYIIDHAYHGWFLPMAGGTVLCAFAPESLRALRVRYLLSYALIWILIGSVAAMAFPAAGPCFQPFLVGPGSGFDDLLTRLHAEAAVLPGGIAALDNQAYLRAALGQGHIVVGAGISAMPSVHNALAILFALAAFQVGPFVGRVMTGYAVLIWIGSIHLGWHYAIDGIVAALLTWLIWRFSGWATDRLLAPPESPAGRLAAA